MSTLRALLYPGAVAALCFAPVLLLGPAIFAIRLDFPFPVEVIGVTFAIFFATSSITAGFGSQILSRVPPARIVRIGLGLSAALCFVVAAAPDAWFIIWTSIVAGLVNGLSTPGLNLVIVQTVPPSRQGLGFGIKVVAVPIAASLAAFGAYAVIQWDVSWRWLFVTVGALGMVLLASVSIRGVAGGRNAGALPTVERTGRAPLALVLLALGGALAANGTSFYTAFLVDSLVDSGLTSTTAALIVGVVGWIGVASRLGAGIISDRIPRPLAHLWAIAGIVLIAAAGMAGLAFGSGIVVLTAATVACFGIGWAWPGLIHRSAIDLFPGQSSIATSFVQTANYVGTVSGALLFGFVAAQTSFAVAWIAPIASAIVAAFCIMFVIREIRRRDALARSAGRDQALERPID